MSRVRPPTVPQLLNSFSILNDLATVSNMEIKDVSAGSFTASLLLTIPDLKMENAVASLTYSSDTSTYTFQVRTERCCVARARAVRCAHGALPCARARGRAVPMPMPMQLRAARRQSICAPQ